MLDLSYIAGFFDGEGSLGRENIVDDLVVVAYHNDEKVWHVFVDKDHPQESFGMPLSFGTTRLHVYAGPPRLEDADWIKEYMEIMAKYGSNKFGEKING